MREIGIGSTVWHFDPNNRVYRRDEQGRSFGGPIYREHWRPRTIIGETSRSWLAGLGNPHKIPKSGTHRDWLFSQQEVDDACWVNDYRISITNACRDCRDVEKLRAIAEIIGWKPEAWHLAKIGGNG